MGATLISIKYICNDCHDGLLDKTETIQYLTFIIGINKIHTVNSRLYGVRYREFTVSYIYQRNSYLFLLIDKTEIIEYLTFIIEINGIHIYETDFCSAICKKMIMLSWKVGGLEIWRFGGLEIWRFGGSEVGGWRLEVGGQWISWRQ
jgi:hypothetical protein